MVVSPCDPARGYSRPEVLPKRLTSVPSVLQVWEEKAAVLKKEYEAAMKEYKASGGGGGAGAGAPSANGVGGATPKKKQAAPVVSPNKSIGAGSGFKSKEYIEESEGSSSEDSEDKPLKKLKDAKKVRLFCRVLRRKGRVGG